MLNEVAWAQLHAGEHDAARLEAELAGDLLASAGVEIAMA